MPHGGIHQYDPQVVRARQTRRNAPVQGRRDVKLGRSPGLNLVLAARSRLCIYIFVGGGLKRDQESKGTIDPIANTRGSSTFVSQISSVKRAHEYT